MKALILLIKIHNFSTNNKIYLFSFVLTLFFIATIIFISTLGSAWGLPAYRWSNWEGLGGTLNGGPAVTTWGEGRLDVFVRGTDNQLHHQWYNANQNPPWRGWEPLGGIHTSDPAAVSWGVNRIDVFERGQNGQLWHNYHNGAMWSGWTAEGVSGLATNGGPAVTTWGPGRLDLFVRGTDNQLYHKWYSNNRWSDERDGFPAGWQPLGGQLTSDPSAVAWGSGRIDVFAVGPSHNLVHRWFDTRDGGWSGWESLGGGLQEISGNLIGSPAVSSWSPGRLDVIVKADHGPLYHKWFNGRWSGWDQLTDFTETQPNSNLDAISWGNGRIDLFGAHPGNNNLIHKWFNLQDQLNPSQDLDGDRLLNGWEVNGIDENNDGIVDLSLHAYGANPYHRDIFIEVDFLQSHRPAFNAIFDIVRAFASAPLQNEDGRPGINLHVQIDEQLPHTSSTSFAQGSAIKRTNFGTIDERSNAGTVAAKVRVFSYALFIHQQPGTGGSLSGNSNSDMFYVSLGAFTQDSTGHGVGSVDEQEGTFMHEFGHMIGLQHGGGDSINCKPNYLSVMSYPRQFSSLISNRPLDYSRQANSIDERSLNEQGGVPGPQGLLTAIGPVGSPPPPSVRIINTNTAVDFNSNGVTNPNTQTVSADINLLRNDDVGGDCLAPGLRPLPGFNDWTNIRYIPTGASFLPGAGAGVAVNNTSRPHHDVSAEDIVHHRMLLIDSIDGTLQNLSSTSFKNTSMSAEQKDDLHYKLSESPVSIRAEAQSNQLGEAILKLQNVIKPEAIAELIPQAQDKVVPLIDNLINSLEKQTITPANISDQQRLIIENPPSPEIGVVISEEDLEP